MAMTPEVRTALRRLDKQFDATRAMPPPIPERERYRHTIEEVEAGGYIRVRGEIYRVVEVSRLEEDRKWIWYELELFGLTSGDTVYLEWEKDDEIEVSLNQPRLSLRDIGVTADQVEEMSDDEEGTIRYDGRAYVYDDDYKAIYYRGGKGDGEKLWCCDFETSDEKWCLTVEEWGSKSEGYEYEVYVSEYLDPDRIEVLVTGAAGNGD